MAAGSKQAGRSKAEQKKAGITTLTAVRTRAATLGIAIASLKRLPKLRTMSAEIDELVWLSAVDKAGEERKRSAE